MINDCEASNVAMNTYFFLKHLKRCVFPPQQNLMHALGLDFITGWFGRLAAKILMPMIFFGG